VLIVTTPKEPALFRSLCEQAGALSIVPSDFDDVTATASENKKITVVWIAFQRFLDNERKAADSDEVARSYRYYLARDSE
jgi:hypothetical protein